MNTYPKRDRKITKKLCPLTSHNCSLTVSNINKVRRRLKAFVIPKKMKSFYLIFLPHNTGTIKG